MLELLLDPAEVLAAQRGLRARLLDRRNAVSWQAGRDLAAQLLLHVDDAAACWQLAVEWLRDKLDVERVDGGYAAPAQPAYVLGSAEACCGDIPIDSVRGITIDNRDPGVARVWMSPQPVVFPDLAQERRLRADLRQRLADAGIVSKIAMALREHSTPFALLCIDHVEKRSDWSAAQYECFRSAASEVLGPVLWASARLAAEAAPHEMEGKLGSLTPAESRVAMLAASGMSYKEIARCLNRSFSTVDHQLRSIRRKLGVSSCTRLAQALAASHGLAARRTLA